MKIEGNITKILVIEKDETSFQFRQCMARVLTELPPVELYHAHDASEALQLMESLKPDVVVIDDEPIEERDLFLDNLTSNHPPIIVQTEKQKINSSKDKSITYIPKNESLAGLHQTLLFVANIATRGNTVPTSQALH